MRDPNFWGYVGAGYGLTAAVIGGYAVWMLGRLRRARRSVSDADAADTHA